MFDDNRVIGALPFIHLLNFSCKVSNILFIEILKLVDMRCKIFISGLELH